MSAGRRSCRRRRTSSRGGTAQAALLVASEIEAGAAMRAVRLDDTDAAVGVAKSQEVLAEDPDLLGRAVALGQLLAQQRRHPEAAQQLAHRRAGAAPREEFVVGFTQHRSL